MACLWTVICRKLIRLFGVRFLARKVRDMRFDAQNRELQDVGLNGLSTEEEQTFPTYADYLNKLRAKLSGETISKMMDDPFSPF